MRSGPAALIYAVDLERLSVFYRELLGMEQASAAADHHVLASADLELVVHAIPAEIAASIVIASPPEPREEQAVKLLFAVPDLAAACAATARLGGGTLGRGFAGPGYEARDAFDPEGNVFQLRQHAE